MEMLPHQLSGNIAQCLYNSRRQLLRINKRRSSLERGGDELLGDGHGEKYYPNPPSDTRDWLSRKRSGRDFKASEYRMRTSLEHDATDIYARKQRQRWIGVVEDRE
jgi:hypothetical protein